MINLFMISILLLILYLTMNKTNIEHMTSDLSDSLVDKISLLNESNISLSAQVNNLKGIIVAWNGITPPTGWALCDGKNETPDLSGRFILDTNVLTEIGKTGGESTHTLIESEIPAHTHYYNMWAQQGLPTGGAYYASKIGTAYITREQDQSGGPENRNTLYVNTTSGSVGGNGAHNNMPPYYVLAYIMKL